MEEQSMINSYTVWLTDRAGVRITSIDDFVDVGGGSLSYVRAVNTVSPLKLTIPSESYASLFTDPSVWLDYRLEVWRRVNGGVEYLDTETVWLLRNVKENLFQSTLQLYAYSANELISRRIVAYAAASAQAQKTAKTDDMIKAIWRENGGTSAIAARQMSGVTTQADNGLGTSITKGFSYRNCLDVFQEICQDAGTTSVPIFFDMVGVVTDDGVTGLQLRTYANQRGLDRTTSNAQAAVILSLNTETLDNIEITYAYDDEITTAYVGGSGQEAARLVTSVTDATRTGFSPYNRRENFTNYSNSNVLAVLTSAGNAALRNGRPKKIITADIRGNDEVVYGRDWFWGDKCTAQVKNDIFSARIDAVQVAVQGGKEDIKANIRGEL